MQKYIDQITALNKELSAIKDAVTPHLHAAIAHIRAASEALKNHEAVLAAPPAPPVAAAPVAAAPAAEQSTDAKE